MKNKVKYPIFGMLYMLSSLICMGQTALKITSEERANYQEEVKHFVQETYYGSLQEYIADDVYQDYIIEKLMLESETKYKPEFSKNNTSDRYLNPLQYLQELSRSYSCYEEGDISISVDGIDVADSFFSHGLAGCYVEATYYISITCKGKELQGGRCRMYCLFPNKAVRRDIRVLQVEPIIERQAYTNGQKLDSAAHAPRNVASSSEEEVSIILRHLLNHSILYWILLAIALGTVVFWSYKKGGMESLKKAFAEQKAYRKTTETAPGKDVYHSYEESGAENKIISTAHEDTKESMDEAIRLYENWEFNEAVKLFKSLANKNDARAQFRLGCCYQDGMGISQDYHEAVKWYRKAAEQGDADAQTNLGHCYQKGMGVSQDYHEAVKWYYKVAKQGGLFAQFQLGYCYQKGLGVPQDYHKAEKWYRKAADNGYVFAEECLAELSPVIPKRYP